MQTNDFDYNLPVELIAQNPTEVRGDSRLLYWDRSAFHDLQFADLVGLLHSGDVLVYNDTKVMKTQFIGVDKAGRDVRFMITKFNANKTFDARVSYDSGVRLNDIYKIGSGLEMEVLNTRGRGEYCFKFLTREHPREVLERIGLFAKPSYLNPAIDRASDERWQTVMAAQEGAVAPPSAGMHLTDELLEKLVEKGVVLAPITLHVGPGTYTPVSVDNIEDHQMHSEYYEISEESVEKILDAQSSGGAVVAVGTTSMRALESSVLQNGSLQAGSGETNIFITPGYRFGIVTKLITNFHPPRSTMIMLTSAFAGYETIREMYQHAIREKYRFLSYGDAVLLERAE